MKPRDPEDELDDAPGASGEPGPFSRNLVVERELAGIPLDKFLASSFPAVHRNYLRQLVREGKVRVDGQTMTTSRALWRNAVVSIEARAEDDVVYEDEDVVHEREEPPFKIAFEDAGLAVIEKPSGVALDPKVLGERCPTLHAPKGDVLRAAEKVDREASGLVIVTKNLAVSRAVHQLYEDELIQSTVLAIVEGSPDEPRFTIDQPLGADERHSGRRVIHGEHAERAETEIEVAESFDGFTAVYARPRTHRTHQVRAHLQHFALPVVGDPMYGHRSEITISLLKRGFAPKPGRIERPLMTRMAIHIQRLQFQSPEGGAVDVAAEPPADLARFVKALRRYRPPGGSLSPAISNNKGTP
jgi:RluA family pseudouridine synthase